MYMDMNMDVRHGILTSHEMLKHLSKYKIGHSDLYLDYRVGLASLICVKKTNIDSLKDPRKTVRLNHYCKSIHNGVINDTHCDVPF